MQISPAKRPDFSSLPHEDDIWNAMYSFAVDEFGITAMMYAFTHSIYTASRTGLTQSLIIRHNVPDDYLDWHGGKLPLDADYVVREVLQGKQRFLWSEVDTLGLSEAERAQHERDKKMGFGVGISFGTRFSGKNGAGCICLGARNANAAQFDALCDARNAELTALVQEFDTYMRPAMIASRIKLTPREKDVLSYSAGGMTAKQIADHLGLSRKTVVNALERARKSVGAVSTMEAVAKSIVYDLVG